MGRHVIDLTGRKFGRLTVIERGQTSKAGMPRWICQCECGNIRLVQGEQLRGGRSQSCGCYAREQTSKRARIHGQRNTALYNVWDAMKQRCMNPKSKAWKYYGGRGVSICEEWQHNFETFNKWANDNGYQKGLTIDRIDVNGDYEPSNCRWVTMREQGKNKRCNVSLTYKGETKLISEWAKELGLNYSTIQWRHKRGWSDEDCITGRTKKGGA